MIRKCFVSNSSSSSFVIMECDNQEIVYSSCDYGCDSECWEEYSMERIDIDEMIEKLNDLKNQGKKSIYIYGGTYSDNC